MSQFYNINQWAPPKFKSFRSFHKCGLHGSPVKVGKALAPRGTGRGTSREWCHATLTVCDLLFRQSVLVRSHCTNTVAHANFLTANAFVQCLSV
jgi:hypothetical protein